MRRRLGAQILPISHASLQGCLAAYLNELEDHIDCATVNGQKDELQDAIDQNQAALDQFQC
jgi:hypothetical protein